MSEIERRNEVTKATMKNLNAYLDTISSDFTIERGNGYFYFSWKEDSTAETVPESINICYLLHCDLATWKRIILAHVEDHEERRKE